MKRSQIILGASAAIAAITTMFAFRPATKFGPGTLFTLSGGQFHAAPCVRVNQNAGICPAVTYYTKPQTSSKIAVGTTVFNAAE